MKNDSIFMISYYSPGKVRTEMFLSNDNLSKDDTYVIAFLDSNIYYVLQSTKKAAKEILIDTLKLNENIDRVPLNDELNVLGIKCYGVKETMKYDVPMFNSDTSVTMQVISHYAKDLYFPYTITPHFSQSSMVYNNNICLSSKTKFDNSTFGGYEMVLTAIKVEYIKNPDSLFQIPSTYSIQTIKMSEMFQKTRTVTIEEIMQEEKEEPEPPPPRPLKKPTKRTKGINPVKG